MFLKRIILLVVSVIGMGILFKTEFYQRWFDVYLFSEGANLSEQMQKQSLEERRERRFGNTYSLVKFIKQTLDTTTFKAGEPLILLPPNDYLNSKHLEMFHLPEPAEIYYHCGIRSVWTTSPEVNKTNWVILPQGNSSLIFVPIRSDEQRRQILDSFSKFKPGL